MFKKLSEKCSAFTMNGLVIGSLGVVYGDIGTSPLYAIKACFSLNNLPVSHDNIFGLISLIFWSLCVVVSLKYIGLVLRADNHGEGGVFALTSLCFKVAKKRGRRIISSLGILGAALFYGDGVITPAISVLGALEGLVIVSKSIEEYITFIAIIILALIFFSQKRGTSALGNFFGPIMIIWFIILGGLGIYNILIAPQILHALDPRNCLDFLIKNKLVGLGTFGAIALVLTGAEALYADVGHFNKQAIRRSWSCIVFPSLILNYFGQGALLLTNPHAIENPFYLLGPNWTLYPLIILSTIATIIASQAIISGVFSMSWQAINLGYLPRMRVIHTSNNQIGQVYIRGVNYLMLFFTIITVLIFKTSDSLATAYGITVIATMFITTIMVTFLAVRDWKWSIFKVIIIFLPLHLIDITFLVTNLQKFFEGGWLPVTFALIVYSIMVTWQKGMMALKYQRRDLDMNLKTFLQKVTAKNSVKIPGIAVFMNHTPWHVPASLLINLEHNKYLHKTLIFISIVNKEIPKVRYNERIRISKLGQNKYQVIANYGFSEIPDLRSIIYDVEKLGIKIPIEKTSFFLSRDIPVASKSTYLKSWQEALFILLSKNATNAVEFFKVPSDRVIELGARFKI